MQVPFFLSCLAVSPRKFFLASFLLLLGSSAQSFTLDFDTLHTHSITSGMSGYMLTVLRAEDISLIPIQVISVLRSQSADFILIRLNSHKLAQGMSGSPVYIDGKLIGAVRSGWDNSSHDVAVVIPIHDMLLSSNTFTPEHIGLPLTLMRLYGINTDNTAVKQLSQSISASIHPCPPSVDCSVSGSYGFQPGSSITVYLVWGDAELSALGTVTAVDKSGNFIAFGHEFLRRGAVQYPCGGAYIHTIINSDIFPLKLSSSEGISGTVTLDTDSGISGKFAQYPSSIPCEVILHDIDTGTQKRYTFRTIADENLSAELISSISRGLCEQACGRKGEGTLSLTLNIDGRESLTYKNIYYSDEDIMTEAFKEVKPILSAYMTQPYAEIFPCGISIKAQVTRNPKILLIEDVTAPERAKPGQIIDVTVKLREYRKPVITRKFSLRVPSDADGVMELIVRGGGTQSFKQSGIAGGWKSITGIENMFTELKAMDTNSELILELNADRTGNFLNSLKSGNKPLNAPDLLPEEEEYLSETKARRKREGTLKIMDSEYYIDGLMRRIIHTEGE